MAPTHDLDTWVGPYGQTSTGGWQTGFRERHAGSSSGRFLGVQGGARRVLIRYGFRGTVRGTQGPHQVGVQGYREGHSGSSSGRGLGVKGGALRVLMDSWTVLLVLVPMYSWAHVLMGSWAHVLIWAHGLMYSWAHGIMGSWAHVLMGAWVHGRMGSWAQGLMGSWAHGLMGSCTHGLMGSSRGHVLSTPGATWLYCGCLYPRCHLPDVCPSLDWR